MAESEDQDQSQKTEEPTAHKLDEAQKKGRVPISRELMQWLTLATITLIALLLFPYTIKTIGNTLKYVLQHSGDMVSPIEATKNAFESTLRALGLPLFFIMVMGILTGALQTKLTISTQALKPKFERLSPLKGVGRIFSKKALVEFLKGLFKIAFVGSAMYMIFRKRIDGLVDWTQIPPGEFLLHVKNLCILLFTIVLASMIIVVIADYAFQWFDLRKSLMMSRDEIRKEQKEMDGDPIIRQRQRQIRHERARKQMMADIPSATVIITNPTHFAVALKYDQDAMDAPKVVAKGMDFIALRIREIAGEHEIPIVENPPLARALFDSVDIGHEIPPEHYKAVAEVIRIVLQMKKRLFK